jgi:hypothetical protein
MIANEIQQPKPFDLVGNPVLVAGIGTGFEGTFAARVRDGNGAELALTNITAGGTGIWGNYQTELALGSPPATPRGHARSILSTFKRIGNCHDDGRITPAQGVIRMCLG